MVVRVLTVWILLFGFWAGISVRASETPVLALIGTPETKAVSDVLLAGLSGSGFADFVEREQIDRLLAERKLSLGSSAAFLQLGRLVDADGLLLLTPSADGEGFVYLRLVAVRQGVVLDQLKLPWPAEDTQALLGRVGTRLAPLLPKLFRLEREAVPISILNIRSALGTESAQRMERALSRLLADRLAAEPNLFVLERNRMDLLREEKEIGFDDSAFWTGSYLLEGVFDAGIGGPTDIQLALRLTPPGGSEPLVSVVKGSSEDLPAMIEELAVAVLAALEQADSRSSWDGAAEAARYVEEGRWALQWGMFREARQAAEAAWALGARNGETAALRARAYLPAIGLASAAHGTDRGNEIPFFLREMHPMKWSNPPTRETVRDVLRALRDYREFARIAPDEDFRSESEFYAAGTDVLRGASLVLVYFHQFPEDGPPELTEVRELCRRIADRLWETPTIRKTYVFEEGRIDDFNHRFTHEPNIYRTVATWGRFWQESPEAVVDLWRELMTFDVFPQVRETMLRATGRIPFIPVWNRRDADRTSALIEAFVGELLESGDPILRLEGRMLAVAAAIWEVPVSRSLWDQASIAIYEAYSENVIEPAFEALFAEIVEQREALVQASADRRISGAIYALQKLNFGKTTDASNRIDDRIRDLRTFWRDLENDRRAYRERLKAEAMRAEQFRILDAGIPVDLAVFRKAFPLAVSPEDAEILLPRLLAYRENIESAAGKGQQESMRALQPLRRAVEQTIRVMEHRINRLTAARPSRPVSEPARKFPPESEPLVLDRMFTLPVEQAALKPGGEMRFLAAALDGNRLRLIAAYDEPGMDPQQLLAAALDIRENRWEVFPVPVAPEYSPNRWSWISLFDDTLYIPQRDGLFRWTWGRPEGESLELPVSSSRIERVSDRLFVTSRDSMLEIDKSGVPVALLASRRRNPPSSPVDEQRNLRAGTLIPGGDGTVRLFLNRVLYEETRDSWRELKRLPEVNRPEVYADVTIFRNELGGKSASVLPYGSLEPTLLYDLADPSEIHARNVPRSVRRSSEHQAAFVRSNLSELLGSNPLIKPVGDRLYYFQEHVRHRNRYPHDPDRHASLIIGSLQGGDFRAVPLVFKELPRSIDTIHLPGPVGRRISEHGFDLLVGESWLVFLHADRGWVLPKSTIDD